MDDDGFFAFILIFWFLFGALVMIFVMAILFSATTPTELQIICEYEGGTMQGDVCIVDDRVFDIG